MSKRRLEKKLILVWNLKVYKRKYESDDFRWNVIAYVQISNFIFIILSIYWYQLHELWFTLTTFSIFCPYIIEFNLVESYGEPSKKVLDWSKKHDCFLGETFNLSLIIEHSVRVRFYANIVGGMFYLYFVKPTTEEHVTHGSVPLLPHEIEAGGTHFSRCAPHTHISTTSKRARSTWRAGSSPHSVLPGRSREHSRGLNTLGQQEARLLTARISWTRCCSRGASWTKSSRRGEQSSFVELLLQANLFW